MRGDNKRPQGDTISRSALLEAFANSEHIKETTDGLDVMEMLAIKEVIDNAPAVEYTFEEAFQKTVCENKLYCPNKRPKAEWKETGYETGALGITYRQTQCSNCGWEHALPMWWNFCPNCGADMKKGGAE